MKKYVNGEPVEITAEEISAMETAERSRPLTMEEVSRMLIASQINSLTVDDSTALRMREFYPEWTSGTAYTVGYKVQYKGTLYKVLQDHTSQETWTPDAAPSMFAKVLIPDENIIPEWEQPESTNAYSKGDKVTHKGKTWVSDVDNNV